MSTNISWTEETWNPIVGCSRISEGCKNCYAATAAKSPRLLQFPQYEVVKEWDGTIEFVESQFLKPLGWRSPKMIFVCSMSDLFHENVPYEQIDKVFAVMAICPQHTFQVLTKRPERMMEYLSDRKDEIEQNISWLYDDLVNDHNWTDNQIVNLTLPLPNVWLGVSVENQKAADSRIPLLAQIPTITRFLSCEPLLEQIDLRKYLGLCSGCQSCEFMGNHPIASPLINWVIVGGESGSGSRECHLDWIRSIVNQCQKSDIPVFVKQLGSNAIESVPYIEGVALAHYKIKTRDKKGSDISQFIDINFRQFPGIIE